MISQITAGSGINQYRSVCKVGGTFSRHSFNECDWINPLDLNVINASFEPAQGGWSNGTGTQIDTNGSLIFDANLHGGGIKNVVVANKGSNTLYYGLNNEGIAVASGGFPLASGEAILLNSMLITKLWALSASGTTVLNMQGTYNYNNNTI